MARKLLTFLGTNPYVEGIYTLESREWKTPFVQTALIRFFQPLDEIIVFVTPQAKSTNWEKLKNTIGQHCPGSFFRPVDITEGKRSEQVWETFNTLLGRYNHA